MTLLAGNKPETYQAEAKSGRRCEKIESAALSSSLVMPAEKQEETKKTEPATIQ